jgi:hypothetical protein
LADRLAYRAGLLRQLLWPLLELWLLWGLLLLLLLLHLLAASLNFIEQHLSKLANLPLCVVLLSGARDAAIVQLPERRQAFLVSELLLLSQKTNSPHHLRSV